MKNVVTWVNGICKTWTMDCSDTCGGEWKRAVPILRRSRRHFQYCQFSAATVARYVLQKNGLFCERTLLDLLSNNWLGIPKTLPFLFLRNANSNPDFQSAWHLVMFPIHDHVSWLEQCTDDIRQFLRCVSWSIYDHDHTIFLVITEYLCCTCTDVYCTLWWNIYIYIYIYIYITGLRLEVLKEIVQDRKKWRKLVEEKTRNRGPKNAKWTQEKAMANHSWTANIV